MTKPVQKSQVWNLDPYEDTLPPLLTTGQPNTLSVDRKSTEFSRETVPFSTAVRSVGKLLELTRPGNDALRSLGSESTGETVGSKLASYNEEEVKQAKANESEYMRMFMSTGHRQRAAILRAYTLMTEGLSLDKAIEGAIRDSGGMSRDEITQVSNIVKGRLGKHEKGKLAYEAGNQLSDHFSLMTPLEDKEKRIRQARPGSKNLSRVFNGLIPVLDESGRPTGKFKFKNKDIWDQMSGTLSFTGNASDLFTDNPFLGVVDVLGGTLASAVNVPVGVAGTVVQGAAAGLEQASRKGERGKDYTPVFDYPMTGSLSNYNVANAPILSLNPEAFKDKDQQEAVQGANLLLGFIDPVPGISTAMTKLGKSDVRDFGKGSALRTINPTSEGKEFLRELVGVGKNITRRKIRSATQAVMPSSVGVPDFNIQDLGKTEALGAGSKYADLVPQSGETSFRYGNEAQQLDVPQANFGRAPLVPSEVADRGKSEGGVTSAMQSILEPVAGDNVPGAVRLVETLAKDIRKSEAYKAADNALMSVAPYFKGNTEMLHQAIGKALQVPDPGKFQEAMGMMTRGIGNLRSKAVSFESRLADWKAYEAGLDTRLDKLQATINRKMDQLSRLGDLAKYSGEKFTKSKAATADALQSTIKAQTLSARSKMAAAKSEFWRGLMYYKKGLMSKYDVGNGTLYPEMSDADFFRVLEVGTPMPNDTRTPEAISDAMARDMHDAARSIIADLVAREKGQSTPNFKDLTAKDEVRVAHLLKAARNYRESLTTLAVMETYTDRVENILVELADAKSGKFAMNTTPEAARHRIDMVWEEFDNLNKRLQQQAVISDQYIEANTRRLQTLGLVDSKGEWIEDPSRGAPQGFGAGEADIHLKASDVEDMQPLYQNLVAQFKTATGHLASDPVFTKFMDEYKAAWGQLGGADIFTDPRKFQDFLSQLRKSVDFQQSGPANRSLTIYNELVGVYEKALDEAVKAKALAEGKTPEQTAIMLEKFRKIREFRKEVASFNSYIGEASALRNVGRLENAGMTSEELASLRQFSSREMENTMSPSDAKTIWPILENMMRNAPSDGKGGRMNVFIKPENWSDKDFNGYVHRLMSNLGNLRYGKRVASSYPRDFKVKFDPKQEPNTAGLVYSDEFKPLSWRTRAGQLLSGAATFAAKAALKGPHIVLDIPGMLVSRDGALSRAFWRRIHSVSPIKTFVTSSLGEAGNAQQALGDLNKLTQEWRLSRFTQFGPNFLRWENLPKTMRGRMQGLAKLEGISPPLWRLAFVGLNNIAQRGAMDESKVWEEGDAELAAAFEEFSNLWLKGRKARDTLSNDSGDLTETATDMFWYYVMLAGEAVSSVDDVTLQKYAEEVGSVAASRQDEMGQILSSADSLLQSAPAMASTTMDAGKDLISSIVQKEGDSSYNFNGQFAPRGAFPSYFMGTKGIETLGADVQNLKKEYSQYVQSTDATVKRSFEEKYAKWISDNSNLAKYFDLRQADMGLPSYTQLQDYAKKEGNVGKMATMLAHISWHQPSVLSSLSPDNIDAYMGMVGEWQQDAYQSVVSKLADSVAAVERANALKRGVAAEKADSVYASVRQRYMSLGLGE